MEKNMNGMIKTFAAIGALLGAGLVNVNVMAADAATADEAVAKVQAAARYLQGKGASGYADFNNASGRWVWKDSYVFVFDCRQDRMVAHPLRPDLVGRPILQITDNAGKYIFKELCRVGAGPGGWVEYAWQKPGAGALSRKITYTLAADVSFASGIHVGAGIYDDKITMAELAKVVEKITDPTKYPAH
jgi:signal transduction histidine kinase